MKIGFSIKKIKIHCLKSIFRDMGAGHLSLYPDHTVKGHGRIVGKKPILLKNALFLINSLLSARRCLETSSLFSENHCKITFSTNFHLKML